METIGTLWLYLVFFAIVAVMLVIDFVGFKHQHGQEVKVRTAAYWSIAWVSVATLFGGGLWLYLEQTAGTAIANAKVMEYFAGYLLEKSLAIDNVFVWLMIFAAFAIPPALHVNCCYMAYWVRLYSEPSLFLLAPGLYRNSLGFCISSVRSWCIPASNSFVVSMKKTAILKIWRF